jgi:hypothetical protein
VVIPVIFSGRKIGHFALCFLEVPSKMVKGTFRKISQKLHHIQRNCF